MPILHVLLLLSPLLLQSPLALRLGPIMISQDRTFSNLWAFQNLLTSAQLEAPNMNKIPIDGANYRRQELLEGASTWTLNLFVGGLFSQSH